MTVNQPANILPLVLLWTFVTGVFQPSPMKSPISKVKPPTGNGRKRMEPTLTLEDSTVNDIRIKCKECQMWFMRVDWMANKDCDNPNCRCPEVQKLRQAANDVIEKASESSKVNIINIK